MASITETLEKMQQAGQNFVANTKPLPRGEVIDASEIGEQTFWRTDPEALAEAQQVAKIIYHGDDLILEQAPEADIVSVCLVLSDGLHAPVSGVIGGESSSRNWVTYDADLGVVTLTPIEE